MRSHPAREADDRFCLEPAPKRRRATCACNWASVKRRNQSAAIERSKKSTDGERWGVEPRAAADSDPPLKASGSSPRCIRTLRCAGLQTPFSCSDEHGVYRTHATVASLAAWADYGPSQAVSCPLAVHAGATRQRRPRELGRTTQVKRQPRMGVARDPR